MIYDCFLFNNEFEILDIRLNTLDCTVDKFVLVEATVSHSCHPKRLFFKENKERFKKFKSKIIHVVVNDTPPVNLSWIVNDFQFSQMKRGLQDCKPSDIVLFGDVDEIPRVEAITKWKDKPGVLKVFNQTFCEYFLNFADTKKPWLGTHMIHFKDLAKFTSLWNAKYSKPDVIIPNGGWHFTHMGGIKRIQQKLTSTTHQELNNSQYNTYEHIKISLLQGKDFLNNGFKLSAQNDDFLPDFVFKNKEKFKALLIDKQKFNFLDKIYIYYLKIRHYARIFVRKLIRNEK